MYAIFVYVTYSYFNVFISDSVHQTDFINSNSSFFSHNSNFSHNNLLILYNYYQIFCVYVMYICALACHGVYVERKIMCS